MTEAERIARGLTEAQREEVLSLSSEWTIRKWAGQQPPWLTWLPPSVLEQACPTHPRAQRLRLTPLGEAVRHLLTEKRDG